MIFQPRFLIGIEVGHVVCRQVQKSGRDAHTPAVERGVCALRVAGGSGVASAAADAPWSRFARRIGFHGLKPVASVPSMGKIELAEKCQPEEVTTTVAKRNA